MKNIDINNIIFQFHIQPNILNEIASPIVVKPEIGINKKTCNKILLLF
ncbi:MAG: hypothetical protein H9Q66_04935 [Spiroplasma ixodetis]|nr:hypothetical protein [Spiroplasma ixodetis]